MQKRMVVMLAALMMLAVPVFSFASVASDEVTSVKIREATPGSTSQDTNTGNGIKTGHIVDTAVTTAKLANGAVTDEKISGKISASKLPIGTTASSVAAGIHNHDSVYQKKYGNVAVVAKSGGNYSDPATALNDITAWCGTPSSQNPCSVKIMPGVYDLGVNGLVVPAYVTVEGSGENATNLIAYGRLFFTDAEIRGLTLNVNESEIYAQNSNFNDITVKGEGGYHLLIHRGNNNTYNRLYLAGGSGLFIEGTGNKIFNSRLEITPRGTSWNYGIYLSSGDLLFKDSSISMLNAQSTNTVGIFKNPGNFEMVNSNITMTGGWNNYGIFDYGTGTTNVVSSSFDISQGQGLNTGIQGSDGLKIDSSRIKSSGYSFTMYGGTMFVGSTKLDSPFLVDNQGGTVRCVNVYDGNYLPITCP